MLSQAIQAVSNLNSSYLTIHGPPGSGKTYTASHIITALLAAGKKIGVSSNSHKAINNLLTEVEACALKQGIRFKGSKKVNEAGQVSLAHLISMGLAAKNIVLLGDQMKLGQPIQGVHPRRFR